MYIRICHLVHILLLINLQIIIKSVLQILQIAISRSIHILLTYYLLDKHCTIYFQNQFSIGSINLKSQQCMYYQIKELELLILIKETVSNTSNRWDRSEFSGSSCHHIDKHSKRKREIYARMLLEMLWRNPQLLYKQLVSQYFCTCGSIFVN